MMKSRKTTKTRHQVGKCPACGRRAVLGRCKFKGGGINKMDHCQRCCAEVNRWKPKTAGAKALSA